MFIFDKHGKMVFFPWGGKKQGYFIKDKSIATKVKKFFSSSLSFSVAALIIAMSIFNTFWAVIGSMFICLGGWCLIYYLYIARITKSLPIAQASYKEVILEKIESDVSEEENNVSPKLPVRRN